MIQTPIVTPTTLSVTMEEVTLSPEELATSNARRERYMKNMAWFEAHAGELGEHHSGQSICIAGETLFFGQDPKEIYARALAAFPEDRGAFFTYYIKPRH